MATIPELQAKLAAFRASQGGAAAPAAAPVVPTTTSSTPSGVDPARLAALQSSLKTYNASGNTNGSTTPIPKDPGALASFAKGIFGAPLTIAARPIQAAAEVGQFLGGGINAVDPDAIDAATSKIPLIGGLIAPVDRNFGDVKKDVGRAAETVALGTGAPIAGGALFGAGASLEQGNDLLSVQTAADAAIGGAGGKVLEWLGKPLLNAAGKVVGTITPKIIKDAAAGGADSLAKFAATHDLPLGISTVTKPIATGIQKGTEAIDSAIGSGFKKGGAALQKVAADQFPGLSPVNHFKKVNEADFVKPSTINKPGYANATRVFNDAKARDIDIGKVATDRGIITDTLHEDGTYNTKPAEQAIRQKNYDSSNTVGRKAIQEAQVNVRRVPTDTVRTALREKINSIPDTSINDRTREQMLAKVDKDFGADSPSARAHPDGYNLENLNDSRISADKDAYANGQAKKSKTAQYYKYQRQVFGDLFDKHTPDTAPLKAFRAELEKNFKLADYLKALHGKKVPQNITQKAIRLFGRGVGGTLGSHLGGFPGFLAGSNVGDLLFSHFEALPNPIKIKVLKASLSDNPAAIDELKKYVASQQFIRDTQLKLPAPGETSAKPLPSPTLFSTKGGQVTPSLQEAVDASSNAKKPSTNYYSLTNQQKTLARGLGIKLLPAPGEASPAASGKVLFSTPGGQTTENFQEAVDMSASRVAKKPGTDRRLKSYLTKAKTAEEAKQEPYTPSSALPVIRAGVKPKPAKKLTDIYIN